MLGILVGIAILVILVVIHEYGHFLAARRNGIEVEEFGVGFPPKLFGKKLGRGIFEGYYSLNLIPLGGFVRLKGESEAARAKGSYGAATLKTKVKITVAGVAMNALIAVLIFTVLAVTGMPKFIENQFSVDSQIQSVDSKVAVETVYEGSRIHLDGLNPGNIISSVNGVDIDTEEDFNLAVQESLGQEVTVEYYDNGELMTTQTIFEQEETGLSGFTTLELSDTKYSLLAAPVVGVGTGVQIAYLTFEGVMGSLVRLLTFNFSAAAENVTGPVGIFNMIDSIFALGSNYIVFIAGVISMTLAIVNILPLPALDGGRLAVAIAVNKFGVKLTENKENMIHLIGFAVLLLLAILVTIVDVGRI